MSNLNHAAIIEAICDRRFLPSLFVLVEHLDVRRTEVMVELREHIAAVSEGRERSLSPTGAVPFVIALLHVSMGTPLFLNDKLLDDWERCTAAEAVAECSHCGYRMPGEGYPRCVLCGGATGPGGVWAQRRARMARMN